MVTSAPARGRTSPRGRLSRGFVRNVAFTSKELREAIRQPQLLLGLVIGPFLILFLFGTAFRGQVVEQPTVLVIPPDSGLSANDESYRKQFSFPFTLAGVVSNVEDARGFVESGKARIIVELPTDSLARIQSGQHPLINITYDELEPVRASQLRFYSYVQTNELNRAVLIAVVEQARASNEETARVPLQDFVPELQAGLTRYEGAVRARNAGGATEQLLAMQRIALNGQNDVRTRIQLYDGTTTYFGGTVNPNDDTHMRQRQAQESLDSVQTILLNMQVTLLPTLAMGQPEARVSTDLLANARAASDNAKAIQLPPAEVLVAPFQAEVKNRAPVIRNFIAFYAPAVLALLLQHISITLTALTLVRERTLGATELFRVSPSAAGEIVFGKFIGYALIAALTGAILTVLLRYTLGVPILGSPVEFGVIVALLIAASLGVGLVISAIARTETQAVQYAMILLLASVFFGNFFLPVDTLYEWAQPVSYSLPITYGVQALQRIMLRGAPVNPRDVIALAAFAVGSFAIGTLLFRRELKRG